jgi:hypothetical protein
LNLATAGEGGRTTKRAEKVSVDVAEDDEDRRVYTEVTNKLRSKWVVDAKFISYYATKRSKYGEQVSKVTFTDVINLAPIALRFGTVCSKQ